MNHENATVVLLDSELGEMPAWNDLPLAWGPYTEVTPVARGGMGMVYRAHNVVLNRVEAIKVLAADTLTATADRARFQFEAEAAAGLDHPNVVPIYGGGEVAGRPYLAMKWVPGGHLERHAATLRTDPLKLAGVAERIARAVHYAHTQGILHRDLKPQNVLLDPAGEPHVTDFGLARRADAAVGLTATGNVVGTPGYMAPEQTRGTVRPAVALDVYGVGAVLYFLLTGRPPFLGDSVAEVMAQVASAAPPAPHSVITDRVAPDLEAICLKCLEKSPADRYPSAEAIADDLARFIRGESIAVRPPGIGEWFAREFRKTPALFPGYVWSVKLWFGVIMLACQILVTAAVWLDAAVGWVWVAYLATWGGSLAALQILMAKRFTRLPATEQHSVMIAIGQVAAHALLCVAMLPLTGSARVALSMTPAVAAMTGLAFFVIGTTHWGRFYWYGLAMMLLAPATALLPFAGPMLYAFLFVAVMWTWAYAVKVTFHPRT